MRIVLVSLMVGLLMAGGVYGQEAGPVGPAGVRPIDLEAAPRPTAQATRAAGRVVLDGVLDEADWHRADSISGFYQAQPYPGYPASERTVVRILYDDEYLYIGAICYDSKPDELTVMGLEQDFSTRDNDLFGLTLDTFLDRRNSFLFAVNPKGALADFQAFNDGRNVNRSWEGVVKVKTRIHDRGWTVEMALPFTTLRFDPSKPQQTWGVNFIRRIRRLNQDLYWAPLARPNRLYKMSQAGTLYGLEGLRTGRNLSIKPYLSGDRTSGTLHLDGADDLGLDGGADLKYSLTPGLTLDLTYHTDFSQVEVDREQINLTRFSTFFPEKRDFFLENAGVFTFSDAAEHTMRTGGSAVDFTLFHSRRVGLISGRPVPVLGGGRLSGRVGKFEVGLLNLQTERATLVDTDTTRVPAENFSVVRLRRNVLGNSDVGLLFINRQATSEAGNYNRSLGVDANFRLLRYMVVNTYLAATSTPGLDGDETAARLLVGWRDPFWNASAFVKQVGEDFNPEVGFVRRRAMRQAHATVGVHPRPALSWIQEVNPYVEGSVITDLDGTLETRELAAGMAADFLDGSRATVAVQRTFERLFDPFTVLPEATIPVGDYTFTNVSLQAHSNSGRPFSGRLNLSRGGFFNGTRRSVRASMLWRANYHLSLDLFAEHNRIGLDGEDFDADLFGGRFRYAFSTRLFASAFVQYNRATEQLVTNVRLNLIHAPLSDVFLVFSERRDVGAGDVLERAVTLKVTKLFAF